MHRTLPALVLATLPLPAFAGVFGEWCSDEGSAIGIEAAGLGNFEHTFCEFDQMQEDGDVIATAMTCRSTFHGGDGTSHVMNEFRTEFSARLLDGERLHVDYHNDIAPFTMHRCEG